MEEEFAGFDLSAEYGGVSLYDWGRFGSGLFLGFMLALGGSSYAGLFNPCLQQRSLITSAMVLFYGFMSAYIDGGFSDNEMMGMMVLYFVQFGIALNLGQCGPQEDDHGFGSSSDSAGGFSSDVLKEYFTLDIEKMSKRQLDNNPFTDYIAKVFRLFGQDDTETSELNDTSALLGTLGIMGAQQAFAAYENWLAYNESWGRGDYFNAGLFLGTAAVDGAVVLYLLAMAQLVNSADTSGQAMMF